MHPLHMHEIQNLVVRLVGTVINSVRRLSRDIRIVPV
jgi:hypothetical protein